MEENEKKSEDKKKKVTYSVLFVPDDDNTAVKKFSAKFEYFVIFFAGISFLIIAAVAYCIILTAELKMADKNMEILTSRIDTLKNENDELKDINYDLQDRILILSDTVNDKVHKEEERKAALAQEYTPTGFPLKGTASYNEEKTELDGQPVAMFNAPIGTSVIATARGTVSSIAGDPANGYIIMVDHGNGYYSVYRNGSKPKVKEGDEVIRNSELFIIEANRQQLMYQIIKNDAYIDPFELMEIYG